MEVKIRPRKATDRGGYYCMPLYTNIQHGKPGWRITQCPECGAQCWRMPLAGVYRAEVEEKPVAGTGWKDHYMGRFEKVE